MPIKGVFTTGDAFGMTSQKQKNPRVTNVKIVKNNVTALYQAIWVWDENVLKRFCIDAVSVKKVEFSWGPMESKKHWFSPFLTSALAKSKF